MKNLFTSLLLSFYCSILFGQTTFEKYYDFYSDIEINSIIKIQNKGYLITGCNSKNTILINTNLLGDTIWTKSFDFITDEGQIVTETKNDSYVIMGKKSDTTTITKVNQAGSIIWLKKYDFFGKAILETTYDNLVIIGHKDNEIYLLKLNIHGESIWMKTFGDSKFDYCGLDIYQTLDNGYVIVGYRYGLYEPMRQSIFIKTDQNGNIEWETLGAYGDVLSIYSIIQLNDSSFLSIENHMEENLQLVKRDKFGASVWRKNIGAKEILNVNNHSLIQTKDNGFAVFANNSGMFFLHPGSPITIAAQLTKFDQFGDQIWTKYYNLKPSEFSSFRSRTFDETDDNGFILGCFGNNNYDKIISIYKTDSLGCYSSLNLPDTMSICPNDLIEIPPYYSNTLWGNGDTNNYTKVKSTGYLSFTVKDWNNCVFRDSLYVILHPVIRNRIIGDTSVIVNQPVSYKLDSISETSTFDWSGFTLGNLVSGQGKGEIQVFWYIIGKDTIHVRETNKFGCISKEIDLITNVKLPSAIQNQQHEILNISPNPTNGFINIPSEIKTKSIEIFDMSGNIVASMKEKHRFNLKDFGIPPGIYYIKIFSYENLTMIGKIVLN